MTQTAAVFTDSTDSALAGQDLRSQIRSAFSDVRPDAVIVFASSGQFDHPTLLRALAETCQPQLHRRGTGIPEVRG